MTLPVDVRILMGPDGIWLVLFDSWSNVFGLVVNRLCRNHFSRSSVNEVRKYCIGVWWSSVCFSIHLDWNSVIAFWGLGLRIVILISATKYMLFQNSTSAPFFELVNEDHTCGQYHNKMRHRVEHGGDDQLIQLHGYLILWRHFARSVHPFKVVEEQHWCQDDRMEYGHANWDLEVDLEPVFVVVPVRKGHADCSVPSQSHQVRTGRQRADPFAERDQLAELDSCIDQVGNSREAIELGHWNVSQKNIVPNCQILDPFGPWSVVLNSTRNIKDDAIEEDPKSGG